MINVYDKNFQLGTIHECKNTDMSRFITNHYTEKSGLGILFKKYTKNRSAQSLQNFGFMIFMIFPTNNSPDIFFCDVFF